MKNNTTQDKLVGQKQLEAYHVAGYAAGIYLNNKSKFLPSVFFNIVLNEVSCLIDSDVPIYQTTRDDYISRVEGGLIVELPVSSKEELNDIMAVDDYKISFEADIINLLIGPLAEAKHISDSDDIFANPNEASPNEENSAAIVNSYLKCFFDEKQKNKKLDELFLEAFSFVNNDANWFAITSLANYIIDSASVDIIYYQEISLILDRSMVKFIERRTKARYRYNGWFKVTAAEYKNKLRPDRKKLKKPSKIRLKAMSHEEKDELICELFDLL